MENRYNRCVARRDAPACRDVSLPITKPFPLPDSTSPADPRLRIADLVSALIRCPSVTPDDAGCQDILAARLNALGFDNEPLSFGDVANLWSRRGRQAPLVVFAGHTDVVPVGDAGQWQVPPFQGAIIDGIVHGRGAADMKGSLAAMIIATESFLARHPDHRGSLAFLLTSDEEGPAVDGTVKVVEHLGRQGVRIDHCVVGEPTSVRSAGDMIKVGRRGSLTGALRIRGRQGHVAYPHLARNPVPEAAQLVCALDAIRWDEGNEDFPPTTFQVSNIHAGTGAGNVIPGVVEILCNFRFSTESSPESLQRRVRETCDALGLDHEITWTLFGLPFRTTSGPLVDAVTGAIAEVTGRDTERSTTGGTSDGRFIAPTGAEVVELGPVNETIHRIDEQVSLDDLVTLSRIYEGILGKLLA